MKTELARFFMITGLFSGRVWGVGEEVAVDPRIHSVEFGLTPITSTKKNIGKPVGIYERMRDFGTPGLSVAVIDDGKLAWAKGYGVSDTKTNQPVTTDALFQAASISKPLAALGALVLVQAGRLTLDENVNQYLKSWKIPENAFTQAHKVTVRFLLSHRAGISDVDFPNYEPSQPLPTLVQILNGVPPARNAPFVVDTVPGEKYAYSRASYDIAQQLIVDASGSPFEEFMQANVLQPLGMKHSSFSQPLSLPLLRLSATAHLAGGVRLPQEFRTPEVAMAGLWSTPSDLTRYLIGVQRNLVGSSDLPIKTDLTKEMLIPQKGHHGLGPVITGQGNTARFGHDGFNEGFESSIVGYENLGQGAVVMANSGFSYMLIKEVLDSIAKVYKWPGYAGTNIRPPNASMPQQEITQPDDKRIKASIGQYRLDAEHALEIIEKNQRLFIEWPGDGEAERFATAGGRMFCAPLIFSDFGSPWLTFVRSAKGAKTVTKILAADDGSQAFVRVN
jgi:CubicO group peptidase (beta-lactamase class C family)